MKISPDKLEEIIASYSTYNGNATIASDYLDVSANTVLKNWRKHNLVVNSHGGNRRGLSDDEISEIIEAHKEYEGNATLASKNIRFSNSTILRYWRNAGLPTRKRGQS